LMYSLAVICNPAIIIFLFPHETDAANSNSIVAVCNVTFNFLFSAD
jgi:hypothetical protein